MRYVWLDGKLVPEKKATVSVMAHALHYGTAAFEGIRFYATDEGPAIFKLDAHLKRLLYSAKTLGMKVPHSKTQLEGAIRATVKRNGHKSGYIRPIIFYGKSNLGVPTHNVPVSVAIIVLPWGKYLPQHGISIKSVSVKRFTPTAFDPNAKIGGVYVNSVVAHQQADSAGADEALLLSENEYITEGSGENIFIVKKGVLYTPPLGNILPGITRDTIMTLAKKEKIPVREKQLRLKDCYTADECFFTGTAAEVTPIRLIDKKKVGKSVPGPITKRLGELYESIITGREPRYRSWLTFVA